MTAISKYPEQTHVVIEPSTTTTATSPSSTTTTTALNENGNSNNNNINIVVEVDDTSKRKWRYCPSSEDDENVDVENGENEGEEEEANCSGYDDELIRISSSPVPTIPNIPWTRSREYIPDLEGLHYELLECYEWLRPTEAERFARVNVCQRVRNVLVDICPDAIFYVFGSVATSLFLPTSDIDISVELQRLSPYDMQVVAESFRNSSNFKDVNVLDRVHVPIIKLTDRETNINIDISFNTSKASSAVEYIQFMRYYFPAVELFTLILKQFLATKHLNQAYTGGLSSYGLILMVVHYMLRNFRHIFFQKDLSQLPIGILSKFFMGFLEYYGKIFNPMNDALAFPKYDEAILMPKAQLTSLMNENYFASILCVQDPLTPLNDVGRGCHNFMQVRGAFHSAYINLEKRMKRRKIAEPLLQSIMTFSGSFVQFRRKLNGLPFENILEHDGNQPYIFGGQPFQQFSIYENDARTAMLYPAAGNLPQQQLPSPRIYFPSTTSPTAVSSYQQQHQFQPCTSTYDENNGCGGIEQLSTSSSEASSTTPTAFSSPRGGGGVDMIQNEYYPNGIQQMPPQIFFPPHHQHQRPIYSYNPYFLQQHHHPQPLFSPYHQQQQFMNDYGNSNQEYYEYSEPESYYNNNNDQQQQHHQQMISEDEFDKILSLAAAAEEDDDITKCVNGVSDAASDSSSGLSTGSTSSAEDSIISCSTVTPECYDDQFSTATTATTVEEESSNVSMKSDGLSS